jgi:hypothetical protein
MEGTLASNLRMASMGGVAARHLSRDTSEVIGYWCRRTGQDASAVHENGQAWPEKMPGGCAAIGG